MNWRPHRPRFTYSTTGIIGAVLVGLALVVAIAGPWVAPHDPAAALGRPGAGPSGDAPLGLDGIGRDVLSRVLHGGLTVLGMAALATLATYLIAVSVGLVAGFSRNYVDSGLMRLVDVLISFPALLLPLILVASLGFSVTVLLLGVMLAQIPGVARIVRTATIDVSTRGYVEAAVARGDRMPSLLTREILPNITPTVFASMGLTFASAVLLIASVNYLGLGLSPPTADWGLMISENRRLANINPWAVLAPGFMLAILMIGVNLVADAYWQTLGRSAPGRRRRLTVLATPGGELPPGEAMPRSDALSRP
jgi:peptide/nickel transport system permease protein